MQRRRIVAAGQKWCSACHHELPISCFGRNRATGDGLTSYCRECHNETGRKNRIKKHGSTRHYHLMRRYGLSEVEVEAMIRRQGGFCAACRRKPAEHVDHDHETGAVRAVLCFTCNVALGNIRDDADLLYMLSEYLEAHAFEPPLPEPPERRRVPREPVAA